MWPLGSDLTAKVQGKFACHIFLGVAAWLC
jgi:hypothetical protein